MTLFNLATRPNAPTNTWGFTRLDSVARGRDNNFNLIRMIAASGVLVSHAYPIALGPGAVQPLEELVGLPLGAICVLVFFAISGFFITKSFAGAPSVRFWFASRVLRLFPGLFVVLALTAFVLGPLLTELPLTAYLQDPRVYGYVIRNLTLAALQFDLPGVFTTNPYGQPINGSLWTLFYEVTCYAGVLAVGIAGLVRSRRGFAVFLAAYLTIYVVADPAMHGGGIWGKLTLLQELSLPFVIGAAFYVYRDLVVLHWSIALAAGLAVFSLTGTPAFEGLFVLWLSYTTFVLAYLPSAVLLRYNGLGDMSYGVYIYAFPVQQLAQHVFPGLTPVENMLAAFPATAVLAALSWTLVEKPALDMRHRLSDALGLIRLKRAAPAAHADRVAD